MSECIEAPGTRDKWGYVWASHKGKTTHAHRVAWIKAYGSIPIGLLVCHSCDNPACVNLDHLWLGTNVDNMRDMMAKGRQCRGEDKADAKLTEEDVLMVRDLRKDGETLRSIADRFGVSEQNVWAIVHYKKWKHI